MISSIRGVVEKTGKNFVVVRVGDISFKVMVPSYLIDENLQPGDSITLFTILFFKEDELSLFGFATEEERDFFELLMTTPGVGPKVALALLSYLSPAALREAIAFEQEGVLTRVPGIGPKTAKSIIFHLRDKVKVEIPAPMPSAITKADEEVIAALTSLGYSLLEAQRAVQSVPREITQVEERLRLALAYFASRG